MISKITPQQLTAINLRYGTTAKSLKILAFADLTAKALFLLGGQQSIKEIGDKVAKIIGIHSVSEKLIKGGLEELKIDHKVNFVDGKWELSNNARTEIENETSSSLSALNAVIDRHFPGNIEKKKLVDWFIDALADFFTYNGDEWVQSICKGTQNFSGGAKTSDELLDSSIKKNSLVEYSKTLKDSFRGFLTSSNAEDQRYLTNNGFAMFSARLVAADVGADPIALEELKGAIFLVDTNFLFALQLESHRLAESFEALGRALKTIDAKLIYIRETQEEYRRVLAGRKTGILRLLDVYPDEVVNEADDDFISTAVFRGCSDKDGFETFFQSIQELPRQMPEGPKIVLFENNQVFEEIKRAQNDTALQDSIQRWYLKLRPRWNQREKSVSALRHDAALIRIAELEKKSGSKIFILTLDRSLQACCAKRVGQHDMPLAIYLEGLIQILAANNAGPEMDAANFAPLLTSILLKRCVPPEHTYSVQDLHWLYSIQKNISKFKPEKIKLIALEVTRARLAGQGADSTKLQRTVNRFYQEEMQNTSQVVEEAFSRAQKAEEAIGLERNKRIELEERLQMKEKKEALRLEWRKLVLALAWRISAALVLVVLAYKLSFVALQSDSLLSIAAALLAFIIFGYGLINTPVKKWREFKRSNI